MWSLFVTQPEVIQLFVYRDDSSTPEDEGALINEELTFVIWDQSEEIEIILLDSMFIQKQVLNSQQIETIPPICVGGYIPRGMGIKAFSGTVLK
jgi:hypothetical protein